VSERGISIRYNEAVESFIEFARTLSAADWRTPVPCTPLWTARDVLSHVSGVPDDGLAGRTDGAATEPWTASQVERNADFAVDELLERWESQYELFGAAIESMGEERPPFDCHSHEHDLRQALGRPGNRHSAIIDDAFGRLGEMFTERGASIALTIEAENGSILNSGDPAGTPVRLTTSRFEVFRSRLGRRSRAQVMAYDWVGSDAAIDSVVDHWFSFGPSEIPIIE
jgi:uncharacterized protein (TIGR03083 family)